METLGLGWASEVAKQGLGYLLLLASLVVLWLRDRELGICRKQSSANEVRMAVALEKAAKAMADATEVDRQRSETDRVNAQVLQALIKQSDIADDRAKERAAEIVRALEQRGGHVRG